MTDKVHLRILIADDYPLIRSGLRTELGSHTGWEICAEATDGRQALDLALKLKPGIVILDFSLPELNGLEVTRQIRKALPQSEILILTAQESEQLVREVLATGAKGLIGKTDATSLLISAVEALGRHEPFFSPKVTRYILDGYLNDQNSLSLASSNASLTGREREVAQLIAEGKSTKEIADLLSLSVKTIETHRANLMAKLHLHSISELVRYAIRNHMIKP